MEQQINKSSRILKCPLTPDLNQFRYQVKETFMYGIASLSHIEKVANKSKINSADSSYVVIACKAFIYLYLKLVRR